MGRVLKIVLRTITVITLVVTILFFEVSLVYCSPNQRFRLAFEPHLTMETGSTNLQSLHSTVSELEHYFFDRLTFKDENRFYKKALNISVRLVKIRLVDNPLAHLAMLLQHEYFGHAARCREFGVDYRWHVSPLPPWGDGSGWVSFASTYGLTTDQLIALYIGGSESSSIYAYNLQKSLIQKESAHYWELLSYLWVKNNITAYVSTSLSESEKGFGTGDVEQYLIYINGKYGIYDRSQYRLRTKHLKQAVVYNLCDPMQIYAIIGVAWGHLIKGQTSHKIPTFTYRGIKFLPGTRFFLTPLGPECYLDIYVKTSRRYCTFYGRLGDTRFENSGGIGFLAERVYESERLRIDVGGDLWWQPVIHGEKSETIISVNESRSHCDNRLGFNTQIGISAPISKSSDHPVELNLQLGYKTHGFLPGHFLRSHLYYSIGISF